MARATSARTSKRVLSAESVPTSYCSGWCRRYLATDVSFVEIVHVELHFRNSRTEEAASPISPLEGSRDLVSRNEPHPYSPSRDPEPRPSPLSFRAIPAIPQEIAPKKTTGRVLPV